MHILPFFSDEKIFYVVFDQQILLQNSFVVSFVHNISIQKRLLVDRPDVDIRFAL